jgi:hypothetical protein
MKKRSKTWEMIFWIFGILFFVIGVLNVFLVDIVPGVLYILLALLYFPRVTRFIENKIRFSIPSLALLLLGLLVLWGTLAVGELMEILEPHL